MNTFRKTSPVESTGKPAEVSDFEQSSLGGGFMGRFGSMRKPKHWSIYPKGAAPDGTVFIQCDNRWGEIDVDSGVLTMSAPHGFANSMSLVIDKVKGKAEQVELDRGIIDQIVDARDRKRIPDKSDVVFIDDGDDSGNGPWSDPDYADYIRESSGKRKFTIKAITEWDEDYRLIDGDSSREDPEDVRDAVNMEHEEKECGDWLEGLPFTCMAEDLDDALDQYNQKYCEYDYVKAIDADYDVGE